MKEVYCKVKEIPERCGAVISINKNMLLKWLDFEGGVIHRIYEPDGYMNPCYFCVVLEHPDLDPVPENQILPEIHPVYQSYYAEDGSLIKVERVSPEKKKYSSEGRFGGRFPDLT